MYTLLVFANISLQKWLEPQMLAVNKYEQYQDNSK